jgi:quinolinate synthase
MKLNTLEKLYRCLLNESPEVKMDKKLMDGARIPIERMFELS